MWICQNSYPIKKIKKSSGVVALVYNQVNLLLNFVQSLIILSLKKFRVVTHFFKGKKIIKFLNFIYNNDFFFPSQDDPVTTLALTWSHQCKQICEVDPETSQVRLDSSQVHQVTDHIRFGQCWL